MQMEVTVTGGELRGLITGSRPAMDSPLFRIDATDRTTVALRMSFSGPPGTRASVTFRKSATVPPAQFARGGAVWADDPEGSVSNPRQNPREVDQIERTFPLVPDGVFHTYFVPVFNSSEPDPAPQAVITQLRLRPSLDPHAGPGQSFGLDFIRIMEAPTILQVSGCGAVTPLDRDANRTTFPTSEVWVRPQGTFTDQYFMDAEDTVHLRGVGVDDPSLPFGITYNCLRSGGDVVTIRGRHFGERGARVLIGYRPCMRVKHTIPQEELQCIVPAGEGERVPVTVAAGELPGLQDSRRYLSYAVGPSPPADIFVSNIGAKRVDLNWNAPKDLWDALSTTGYALEARRALTPAELFSRFGFDVPEGFPALALDRSGNPVFQDAPRPPTFPVTETLVQGRLLENMAWADLEFLGVPTFMELPPAPFDDTSYLRQSDQGWGPWEPVASTSNVTVTTVLHLRPNTQYQLRIAALAEDTVSSHGRLEWQSKDPYGHRPALRESQRGPFTNATDVFRTLRFDIHFPWFDANQTLRHGPVFPASSVGPLGQTGGEGQYGLFLVGSAGIAGCNATHSCCDGFAPVDVDEDDDGVADVARRPVEDYWRRQLPRPYPPRSGVLNPQAYAWATADYEAFLDGEDGWVDESNARLPRVPPEDRVPPSSRNRTVPRWTTCQLACAATARLRPPSFNDQPWRREAYPIPTAAPIPHPTLQRWDEPQWQGARPGQPVPWDTVSPGDDTVSLGADAFPNGMWVGPTQNLSWAPSGPCGPALRLTGSHPRQAGAAWYGRRQQLREGFSTTFVVRLSQPSTFCRVMDDQYTKCRCVAGQMNYDENKEESEGMQQFVIVR